MKSKPGTWILYLISPFLLWFTFKDFPFSEMKIWLSHISGMNILILFLFNLIFFNVMGIRWLYLLGILNIHISFIKLTIARLIGFAWSYITPGTQIGGEIFQLKYIQSDNVSSGAAVLSLFQDRVLEFLGNFLFIILVLTLSFSGWTGFIIISGTLFIIFIYMSFKKYSPEIDIEKKFLKIILFVFQKFTWKYLIFKKIKNLKLPQFMWPEKFTERLLLFFSSGITPVIALLELFIFFNISSYSLNIFEALVLLSVIKLSYYVPVPGALGFFEAGIFLTGQLFAIPPLLGLGFIFYSRIRDLIQVGAGLLLSFKINSKKLNRS